MFYFSSFCSLNKYRLVNVFRECFDLKEFSIWYLLKSTLKMKLTIKNPNIM